MKKKPDEKIVITRIHIMSTEDQTKYGSLRVCDSVKGNLFSINAINRYKWHRTKGTLYNMNFLCRTRF